MGKVTLYLSGDFLSAEVFFEKERKEWKCIIIEKGKKRRGKDVECWINGIKWKGIKHNNETREKKREGRKMRVYILLEYHFG